MSISGAALASAASAFWAVALRAVSHPRRRLVSAQERSQAEDQDDIAKSMITRDPATRPLADMSEILARCGLADYTFPVPSGDNDRGRD